MTMTRPASVLALLALLLATLTARATVLRPGAQTLALGNGVALAAPPSARPTLAGARADYGRLPLSFEPNRGQVSNRQVRYLAHGAGYSLYLTDRSAIIALRGSTQRSVVTLQFQHTSGAPRFQASNPLPGRVNYFLGNTPNRWHTNIPTYARVSEQQLYPGVSAVYYGHAGRLEYDLVLQPGAHLPADALRIGGAGKLHLDRAGNLLLGESVRLNAPSIYQLVGGIRRAVDGKYQLTGHNQLGFRLGQYDHRYPVVIDPVLVYSTYLGGSNSEFATAIAVDGSGDAYIAGYTASSDFPTCPTKQPSQTDACASNSGTTLQTTLTGGQNAFVAKLNPTGSALLYSTYLGGSQIDQANAIAVDGSGNAYVAGFTSSTDFPTCPTKQPSQTDACASSSGTTLQTTNKAGTNRTPFVTELNSAGSALIYSTYLGGSSGGFGNEAYAIAVDSSGDAYVAGDTTSTDFPTCPTRQPNQTDACDAGNTTTTLQTTNKTNNGNVTAFVAKLSPASGVTAARVSRFTVSHHGRTLLFRWRMALQSGVLGFDLFAGQHRLNAHTIPAHRAAAYRFSTGRRGDAPFTLHVLLAGGGQVTLSI